MPYCNIKTTVKVEKKKELSKELTKVIGLIPGKTENWVMTSIDDEAVMTFAGTDEPCALITLKTYGEPAPKYYDMVTRGFTDTVSKMLGIRPDRIYVATNRSSTGAGTERIFSSSAAKPPSLGLRKSPTGHLLMTSRGPAGPFYLRERL